MVVATLVRTRPSRGDLRPREPLRARSKHLLRPRPPYHPNHSSRRVIGYTLEGAAKTGPEPKCRVSPSDEIATMATGVRTAIPLALRRTNARPISSPVEIPGVCPPRRRQPGPKAGCQGVRTAESATRCLSRRETLLRPRRPPATSLCTRQGDGEQGREGPSAPLRRYCQVRGSTGF